MLRESQEVPSLSPEISEQIIDFIREYIECAPHQREGLEKEIIFQDQVIANISIGEFKGRPVINTRVGNETITSFTTQIDKLEKQVKTKGWQYLEDLEQPGNILGPYELIVDEIENTNPEALTLFDPDLKPLLEEYQTKDITQIPVKIPLFRLMQIKFNRDKKREMVYIFNQDIPLPPEGFTEEELKRINGKVKYNTLTVAKETPYCGLDYSNKDKPNSQSYLQELTLYAYKKKIEPGMTQLEKDQVTLYNQVSESATQKIKKFAGPIMKYTVNGAQKGDIFGITNDVIYSNIGYYLFTRGGDEPIITFTYHNRPIVDINVYGRHFLSDFQYCSYPISLICTKDRNGTRDRLSSRYTWPVSDIKNHLIPSEQKQDYLNRPLTPPIVPQQVLDDWDNLQYFFVANPSKLNEIQSALYRLMFGGSIPSANLQSLELTPYTVNKILDVLYAKLDGKNICVENRNFFANIYKMGLGKSINPNWDTDSTILNAEIKEFEKYFKIWLRYQEKKGRGIDYIAVRYDNIVSIVKERERNNDASMRGNKVNENLPKTSQINNPTTIQNTTISYTKEQLDEFTALMIKEYKNTDSWVINLSTEERDKMKKYYKGMVGFDMDIERGTQRRINDINRFNKQAQKQFANNPQKHYLLEYFRKNKDWMTISAEVDIKIKEVMIPKNPLVNISFDSITLQDAESLIDCLNIQLKNLALSNKIENFMKKNNIPTKNYSNEQVAELFELNSKLDKLILSDEQNQSTKKLYMAFSRTPLITGWGNHYLADEIISLQLSLPGWLNEQVKKGQLNENSALHKKWNSLKEQAVKFREEKTIKDNQGVQRS